MQIVVAPDAADAATEAAGWIARRIRAAARSRGVAHVALSGGSTPRLMIERLAALDVPWSQVHVWQVDERVAPDGDPARNAGLLAVLPARSHLMAVTALDLPAAARRYASALPERLDVVHLGVGDDGHTASWPPGDPVVESVAPVAVSGVYRGHVRMTLTPVAVNAARARLVLATGADKAVAIARWLLGDPEVAVQRLRRGATTLVLDEPASSALAAGPRRGPSPGPGASAPRTRRAPRR